MTEVAPCGWEADMGCCSLPDTITADDRMRAIEQATAMLWRLTGRHFGVCRVDLRPCNSPCRASMWSQVGTFTGGWIEPYMQGGRWYNGGCGCVSSCSCDSWQALTLPGPVYSVIQIKVDGVIIDPSLYVVRGNEIARTGNVAWPQCQDLTKPDTETGTWSVAYRRGVEVPIGGAQAAGALACEIAKSCAGLKCRLPDRVTDITREGVTMTMIDPQDYLADGLTGLIEVDRWIRSVNPDGLRRRPAVWSPDLPRHRTV